MVPGRPLISLTIAWGFDYDPRALETVNEAAPSARQPSLCGLLDGILGGAAAPTRRVESAPLGGVGHLAGAARSGGAVGSGSPAELGPDDAGPEREVGRIGSGSPGFDAVLKRFLEGGDDDAEVTEQRHNIFKLIPRLENANWMIRFGCRKQCWGAGYTVLLCSLRVVSTLAVHELACTPCRIEYHKHSPSGSI